MESTWTTRDLPVLEAIVQKRDAAFGLEVIDLRRLAEDTGFDLEDVARAAVALEDGGLIELQRLMTGGDPGPWLIRDVSGRARQLVGQWPTAEQFADALVGRLEQAAEEESDPGRRSRLQEAARAVGGAARTVVVDVAAAVISKQLGG
ncbi:hypothetical protein ABT247_17915 [Kitasatospora sp. NPDC001539]|uniref:hypothetical protein n=1 Tax=Kitasatospora sp. NPDC001539 TaxID=3154384 RepID=UPI00333375AE